MFRTNGISGDFFKTNNIISTIRTNESSDLFKINIIISTIETNGSSDLFRINNTASTTGTNGPNELSRTNNGISTTGTNESSGLFETNNTISMSEINGIADDLFNMNNVAPISKSLFRTNKFTSNLFGNNNGVSTSETTNNTLNSNAMVPYGQTSLRINSNILIF
jgi:hypothetical protein